MRLIKVETKGFKSFADNTILNFDGGVVGIVGPNGSGKSNINDAIKWVLGEQSIKSLRGDTTDDIIFSGSKTVPAMNKASVSLTFDNSQKKVSLPHKTFTITRSVERGVGGNKYFINDEPAKLKDIKEVAMESGIGKSSLAIISQGTIQNIAQASPEERRGIFEEAAGISKYKSRKVSALKKLDKTSEALEKIETVARELERQIAPLKRQADKAKIFISKKDDLKKIEIGLISEDLQFFGKKLNELNSDLSEVIETKENIKERISISEKELEEKNSLKFKLENSIHSLSQRLQNISEKLRNIEIVSSQASQRRQMIIDGQITSSSDARLIAIKEELQGLSKKINQYRSWDQKSTLDINEKKHEIASQQTKLANLRFESDKTKSQSLKLKTKIAILKDHRDNKTNLFKGVKTIVENNTLIPGYRGLVSDIVKVDEKYQVAISTILSNAMQHIVVSSPEGAIKGVEFLKANKAGRATFIPLSVIKPKGINENYSMIIQSQEGFIGIASNLVNVDSSFEILKKFLLGNIVIASDIQNANKISKIINHGLMIVTLSGDVIRAGGVITGGENNNSKNSFNSEKQIEDLGKLIPHLDEKLRETNANYSNTSTTISNNQSLIAELNIETAKVREKMHIVEMQFKNLKSQYESETNKTLELNDGPIEDLGILEFEKSQVSVELKSKREQIISINNDLSSIIISKTELEKSLRDIIDSSSTKMNEKNKAEFIINSQKQRLSEEYEITQEMAINNFSLEINREKARDIVSKIRHEIKELGNVNVDSIKDYEEVSIRFHKISSAKDELFSAQQTIISAINEMDQIITSKLDKTVKEVNFEMDGIFKTMFGGGFAEVKYTNPNDLLTTGIDVIAQPPGKTVKNLKLFSGGEKAIVAITVLFAILKSKPLPLCILDEVEAALDDANVIRYANYLQELKNQTQFIVVTHRVGTMSRVDHLFGATMQTRGVTSFFTVKLSDAKKLVD